MRIHFLNRQPLLLSVIVATLLSACGITGGTTHTVVPLEGLPATTQMRPVNIAAVDRDDVGVRLMNVGVFEWGKFDDNDQTNIKTSLVETLKTALLGRDLVRGDSVYVHVLIRKYFVGSSNNAVAIFAGVDWALVDLDRKVLFSEMFYATAECHFPSICTLGGQKVNVNNAIVRRVAQKAIAIAAGSVPKSIDIEGTYSKFDRAIATMPDTLKSEGSFVMVGSVPVLMPGSPTEKVSLQWGEMRSPIDWSKKLSGLPK